MASAVLLMLPGAWGNSVTVVEFAQLPAGLAAWQSGMLSTYRVCGPFSKLLYAFPAYAAGARVGYPASFDAELVSRREWELGRLFQVQASKAYLNIYRGSRLLPILLTVLGGCLVCEWSTGLFGTW
ncbi:ArnT family glycosyltransferase, partial [Singulisphaera rosea]